jgi:hypothetical protein
MSKSQKVLKEIAFLFASVITACVFGAFAAWGMSSLDPAMLELIGNMNSTWVAAPGASTVTGFESVTVLGRADSARPWAISTEVNAR